MRAADANLAIRLEHDVAEVGTFFVCSVKRSPNDGETNEKTLGQVRAVRIALRMTTEGRGDEDRKDYATQELAVDDYGMASGEVRLHVPSHAPISYDGSLIRVRWHIEARTDIKFGIDQMSSADVLVIPAGGLGVYTRPHPSRAPPVSDPMAPVPGTTFGDRYRTVGLERNPFTAPQLGSPSCTAFVSRGLPDPPPPWSRTLVQAIGDSGFGKSSHLEHWRAAAPGPSHYIPRRLYRNRWQRPPSAAQSNGVIYGDEIDRMPMVLRRTWFNRLATHEVTLVIGTHIDLAELGHRTGFDVITHRLAPFDRATLERVIDLRLRTVALDSDGSGPLGQLFSAADIDRVYDESAGNPEEADVICHRLLAHRVAMNADRHH